MSSPSLRVVALFGLSVFSASFSRAAVIPLPPRSASDSSSPKIRGVNLGGWLVLEPWITPSLFDVTNDSRIIDEYTFGQYQNTSTALASLKNHWDTWITEQDFIDIANAGLTHVRLPVGYWAYDVSAGEPYIQGQIPYVSQAVQWAKAHGLKVIIDLHGLPGSQNGFDNSGQKTRNPSWYKVQSNIDRTNAIIKTITDAFKNEPTVAAIAPINEPKGSLGAQMLNVTKQYYYDSYTTIRNPYGTSQQSDTSVVISNAFQSLDYWKNFMPSPQYTNVIMDIHIYQMFSVAENQRSDAQHISAACSQATTLSTSTLPIIVGEWTPAATDCAKYLNGRGIGSRYDGTYNNSSPAVGSCAGLTGYGSAFSEDYKTFLRQYWEAQVITYEKAGHGWMQWAWKTEMAEEWSYQAGLDYGWIPQDPTDLKYPDICDN